MAETRIAPDGWEYHLTIPYETEDEIQEIVDDLLSEAESIAELRYCFIEASVVDVNDRDRSWA